jgi:hypothetical protein
LSFDEEQVFSALATKEKQQRNRVAAVSTKGLSILPISIVFGANASGKSNFVGALQFAQQIVVAARPRPEDSIPVQPFRLVALSKDKASRFDFTLLCGERIYRYQFGVTYKEILSETLHEIVGDNEKLIFCRASSDGNQSTQNWDISYFKKSLPSDQFAFLEFKSRDTQRNQLFLNSARGKDINEIDEVADWFRLKLTLISPNTVFKPVETILNLSDGLREYCDKTVRAADTGIVRIDTEEVNLESSPIPPPMRDHLAQIMQDGQSVLIPTATNDRFALTKTKGELHAFRLVAYHAAKDGPPIRFEFPSESEGTRRLIDLLPAFHELVWAGQQRVFIIDELDRSLHTHLTWKLIESFVLTLGPSSRCQLIVTTHDVMLLDQDLVRRDELWFVEKNIAGDSHLRSLSEFKDIRYDKDIRKAYLEGRFGGTPQVLALPNQLPAVVDA